jgi:hypothetical protein
MRSAFGGFALSILLTLLIVAPSRAAGTPSPVLTPTVQASMATLDASLQLQPMHSAGVTTYTATTDALLGLGTQPLGAQRAAYDSSRHLRWTIIGAIAGLAVGVINHEDRLADTLLGGGIGLGLSFVVGR